MISIYKLEQACAYASDPSIRAADLDLKSEQNQKQQPGKPSHSPPHE